MKILTLAIMAAVLVTIATFASGISAMAHDGEVGHQSSAQWMMWRVVFQGLAFLLILAALFDWP